MGTPGRTVAGAPEMPDRCARSILMQRRPCCPKTSSSWLTVAINGVDEPQVENKQGRNQARKSGMPEETSEPEQLLGKYGPRHLHGQFLPLSVNTIVK
ncbi:hypothetical protein MTP99_000250 [Tenebrio molitor]|nr:hypothetical protein MTP99_000250 [Tenebrio molitor]